MLTVCFHDFSAVERKDSIVCSLQSILEIIHMRTNLLLHDIQIHARSNYGLHTCTSRLSAKKCSSFEVRKVQEIAALFVLFHRLAFPLFLKKIRSGLHYFGETKLCINWNFGIWKVYPTQMLEVARWLAPDTDFIIIWNPVINCGK